MSDRSVGIYFHLPFCERVCPYCDFAVVAARVLPLEREARYREALVAELSSRAGDFEGAELASVYFGGGTPALFTPDSVARLVEAARAAFPVSAPDIEITLEANPSSLERERLPGFRQAGVNRLSMGIQSFDDQVLRGLGRAHKGVEGQLALEAARGAGFDNISIDLLFAAPMQTLECLRADLEAIASFAPEHVSSYELIIEPETPFELAARRGQLRRPAEDEVVAMLEAIDERLGAAGLERYELASHARPGSEAVHNSRYWRRLPVLGLGMGAFSNEGPGEGAPHGRRRANTRELAQYLERVEAGESPAVEDEVFDARVARGEAMFLALRCSQGVDARAFESEFGSPPRGFYDSEIRELVEAGLLDEDEDAGLRLTGRGRLLADLVSERFV